jgi:predicted RecB family nuclease
VGPDGTPRPPRVSAGALRSLWACERRLYLERHAPALAAPRGAHDTMLRELAGDHVRRVRERFSDVRGPIRGEIRDETRAAAETVRLLRETRATLHRPVFLAPDGTAIAVPDFVYWEDEALVVHDARLASRIEGHYDIRVQLTHHAALIEEAAGIRPARLEVTSGRDQVLVGEPIPDSQYRALRARALGLLSGGAEPDVLKAHSRCESCPFYRHCWSRAEADGRIEAVPGMRHEVLRALGARGVRTLQQLASLDPEALADSLKIGRLGRHLVLSARALRDRAPVWLETPRLPPGRPLVWLDCEGDSDPDDGAQVVYLWGLAVDPDPAGGPLQVESLFGDLAPGGDAAGWRRFLARAGEIRARFPGAVWVHYSPYERTAFAMCRRRYGDPEGVTDHIERSAFDLHAEAITRWVKLPLRSLSIKHVAPFVGFHWSDPESGSAWSLVQYRRARATADPGARRAILDRIAAYNRDDLEAMRAVWRWIEQWLGRMRRQRHAATAPSRHRPGGAVRRTRAP